MKQILKLHTIAVLATLAVLTALGLTACKDSATEHPHVGGLLEGPLAADSAPARVLEAMNRAVRFHEYEIMSDTTASVAVFCIAEADTSSTEGYGMVVVKGSVSTTFPHIRNVRQPHASYDRSTGTLWLASSAMEGTGVAVERLYQLRFRDNDSAYVAYTFEPYDLQQQVCQRLGYSIDGQQVILYDDRQTIASVTCALLTAGGTEGDTDAVDDGQSLWIGEQMEYDLSGPAPCLLVTPGVKSATGSVLSYDDMPTLCVPLTISNDGTVVVGTFSTR